MIIREELLNNKNYHISEDILNRININKIKKIEICNIKLKDIKLCESNKIISLNETCIYKYLHNNENDEKYINYIKTHSRKDENHNIKNFKNLQRNMSKYDIKKSTIIVDNFNLIIDGRHRLCILLNKYGENYEVKLVKIYYSGLHIRTLIKIMMYKIKKFLDKRV